LKPRTDQEIETLLKSDKFLNSVWYFAQIRYKEIAVPKEHPEYMLAKVYSLALLDALNQLDQENER
jgi:hypothetical protein